MAYVKLSNKKARVIIHQKYGGRCAYCGKAIELDELQIDHIIPARRKMDNCVQGTNDMENLNPACAPCNYSKSSMDLDKWREELNKKLERLYRDSSTYRLCVRFKLLIEVYPERVEFYFERYKKKN